jgi:hypothetical protein
VDFYDFFYPSQPPPTDETYVILLSPERVLVAVAGLLREKTLFSVEPTASGDCFLTVPAHRALALHRILNG